MYKIVPIDFDASKLIEVLPLSMSVERAMSAFVTFPTEVSGNTLLMLEALRVMPRKSYEALSAYESDILAVAKEVVDRDPRNLLMALELIFNLSTQHFAHIVFEHFSNHPEIYDVRRLVSQLDGYDSTTFVINASLGLSARALRLTHPASLSSGWTNNTQ